MVPAAAGCDGSGILGRARAPRGGAGGTTSTAALSGSVGDERAVGCVAAGTRQRRVELALTALGPSAAVSRRWIGWEESGPPHHDSAAADTGQHLTAGTHAPRNVPPVEMSPRSVAGGTHGV